MRALAAVAILLLAGCAATSPPPAQTLTSGTASEPAPSGVAASVDWPVVHLGPWDRGIDLTVELSHDGRVHAFVLEAEAPFRLSPGFRDADNDGSPPRWGIAWGPRSEAFTGCAKGWRLMDTQAIDQAAFTPALAEQPAGSYAVLLWKHAYLSPMKVRLSADGNVTRNGTAFEAAPTSLRALEPVRMGGAEPGTDVASVAERGPMLAAMLLTASPPATQVAAWTARHAFGCIEQGVSSDLQPALLRGGATLWDAGWADGPADWQAGYEVQPLHPATGGGAWSATLLRFAQEAAE